MDRELRSQEHFKRVFTVTVEDERHLRSVTANHIRRRDECVARVFAYMCLLKALPAAQRLGDRPHFRCEKAVVQDRRSLGRFSMQAAHCLPGQIYVGGHLPWDLFPAERGGAAGDLRRCFEAVDNLPVSFNWADSQAEGGATEQRHRSCHDSSHAARVSLCRRVRPATPGDTGGVGYSPYRKFKARTGDYVMVAAAAVAGAGLLAWAFFS